jgi:hypothetical protein
MAINPVTKVRPGLRVAVTAAGGAALVLASLPGSAFALDSQRVWQGIATTTASTTAQCQGVYGSAVDDTEVSIFRPKILSTDTNTSLSFVFLRAAFSWENASESTVKQMHGTGNYDGFAVNSRAKFFDYTGQYSFTVSPATIIASTPSITITGTIKNYIDVPGCNVTFKGVYAPRID